MAQLLFLDVVQKKAHQQLLENVEHFSHGELHHSEPHESSLLLDAESEFGHLTVSWSWVLELPVR